jgi:hypothetical protein
MDGHIAKPVQFETLMRTIADAIGGTLPQQDRALAPPAEAGTPAPSPAPLDRSALGQMLAYLPPGEVAGYLETVRKHMVQMLRLLDRSAAPALLADTAHMVASSVGVFGFNPLSRLLRDFERLATREAHDHEGLILPVREEIVAALAALDEVMHENRVQPA